MKVTVELTEQDMKAGGREAVARAVRRAFPGALDVAVYPVSIAVTCFRDDGIGSVVWEIPTPEPVVRHVYGPLPGTPPYAFGVEVPGLLAGLAAGAGDAVA